MVPECSSEGHAVTAKAEAVAKAKAKAIDLNPEPSPGKSSFIGGMGWIRTRELGGGGVMEGVARGN